MHITEEHRPGLTKWYLDLPIPQHAVFHHLLHDDHSDPHGHPWAFRSYVWEGWYTEEVYGRRGLVETRHHPEGSMIDYPEDHIHRIVAVSPGGCFTLIKVAPNLPHREVYVYRWTHSRGFERTPQAGDRTRWEEVPT